MTQDKATELCEREERRLVERLKSGDASALTELWHAYANLIYASVIFPSLCQRELAEEVLQNTFIKAFERISGFNWRDRGILPWLKTIARNMVIDVHRRHRRTETFCRGYQQHLEVGEIGHQEHRPDTQLSLKQERATKKRRVRSVVESGELNPRYRQAIELRLFNELDREECAAIMAVKVGTFDVLFHRAVKRFETLYRQMYPQDRGGEQ